MSVIASGAKQSVPHRSTDLALGRAEERNGGKADLETPGQNVLKIADELARHWETPRQQEKALIFLSPAAAISFFSRNEKKEMGAHYETLCKGSAVSPA